MIQFVQTTNSHIPQILTFMEAFYAIDDYVFEEAAARVNVQKFINDEHLGRLWLLKLEDEAIGYLALTFGFSFEYGGRDAFIDELYLDKAYRGKGHGTAILKRLEAEAAKLDVRAVHLEVESHNEVGKGLYKKSGYQINGRILMTRVVR